jgi:hypothetical protein
MALAIRPILGKRYHKRSAFCSLDGAFASEPIKGFNRASSKSQHGRQTWFQAVLIS